MKRLIALSSIIVALSIPNAFATFTTSITVLPATFTNVLILQNGSAYVPNMTIASTGGTNASATVYDSPTNLFTFSNPAYTNLTYYTTNYVYGPLTNYYGGTYYLTNLAQVTITNNVAPTTNSYSAYYLSSLANVANTYSGINAYFQHGIWITNTSTQPITFSLQYQ